MSRQTISIVLIILVWGVGASATTRSSAATPFSERGNWVSVRSKHLLVIGNGNERDIRQVAIRLEQFREIVSQVFSRVSADSPVPTTVIVFKDDASYGPFKTSENNAGYFQPGPDVNYITLSTESRGDQDPYNIIFHEYTHLLVNNSFGSSPAWFNEGLAELFSTLSLDSDQRVILGRPIRRHINSLHQNPMLPLRTLFQVDVKSPYYNESRKQSIFYAESWALIHLLMLNKSSERANQLLTFLDLLRSGTSQEAAFQTAFSTTFENMETELRTYVQQDRYRFTETSVVQRLTGNPQMISAPVSEGNVQAYLGDMLAHSHRQEAESYLQRALQLNPNLTFAYESLGILKYQQGKSGEAINYLQHAVDADSRNALVQYFYAAALCRPEGNDGKLSLGIAPDVGTKARTALKKAIALRPDFTESYNLLAYVNLVSGTEIDETIQLLQTALRRTPQRLDLVYMLGQLYMHDDNYQIARPLLEKVVAGSVDDSVRSHSQLLLKAMTDIETERAQKEAARRARGLNPTPAVQPAEGQFYDPSIDLREALRIPAKGEVQVQGTLMGVDCDADGLVFLVKSNSRILRLRNDSFQQVRRTTYTADVKGTITCGARKPENLVVVCYLPTTDKRSKADGVLSSVEFVPGDFKLLP